MTSGPEKFSPTKLKIDFIHSSNYIRSLHVYFFVRSSTARNRCGEKMSWIVAREGAVHSRACRVGYIHLTRSQAGKWNFWKSVEWGGELKHVVTQEWASHPHQSPIVLLCFVTAQNLWPLVIFIIGCPFFSCKS